MNIQIIKDPTGNPTSVVISYQEWQAYELQNRKIRNELEELLGLAKRELQIKIDESEEDYRNGGYYTTEQLDEEMKNW